MRRVALGCLMFLALVGAAMAQTASTGRIVSACGTPGITYTAGAFGPFTVDTNGNLCSSGGGGGGGAVTIANGADVVEGQQTDAASCASPRTVSGCLAQIDADVRGVGTVGGLDVAVSVVPTIQNAAYASGNAVGALQSVAVFRTTAQPSGILTPILLAWKGTETTPLTFFIFDTNPTGSTCTDKSAFSLAAADIPKLAIQPFTLTAAAPSVGTTTTSATATYSNTPVKNQDGAATLNLYVCAVSGGTFTPAVGDLTYKIPVAQD